MEKFTNEQIIEIVKKHFAPGGCSNCVLNKIGHCTIELAEQIERAITDLETQYANMRDNFESLQKEHARQTEEYNRKLTAARDRIRNITDVNAELTATCARKDEKIERLKKDNKIMLERNSELSTRVLQLEGLKQPKPTVSAQIHNAIQPCAAYYGGKRPARIIINRSCLEKLEAEIKPIVRDWEAVKTVARFEGIPVEVTESDKNEKPRFSLSYDYRTFDVE